MIEREIMKDVSNKYKSKLLKETVTRGGKMGALNNEEKISVCF